ncbi:MAG: hypothetical protein A2V84_08180 [Chloroflexi bacterium RBG_16_70_13]|nr:MAG: hypothetical protein A2V84_08180 [Chloroflexi bacterium RBG_16_70_13]
MSFPVAGVTIPLPGELRLVSPLEGIVTVARTNRGILVDAPFRTAIAGTCSRCLLDIEIPIDARIEEEVLPSLDIASGLPVDRSLEPDAVRLTGHHELELEPLVRDAISLAEPIAPLCRPDCPGLCLVCGERLGPGHATHPDDDIDPRLAALRAFRVDDEAENG